jgi:hypothetical protein
MHRAVCTLHAAARARLIDELGVEVESEEAMRALGSPRSIVDGGDHFKTSLLVVKLVDLIEAFFSKINHSEAWEPLAKYTV